MKLKLTVLWVILGSLSASLPASVIRVPADQPTIQAGIYAAAVGDTVLVADGVYTGTGNQNITFFGRAITVVSENGPESCIVDGETGYGRGFNFVNDEGRDSVLSGFTVRNCQSTGIFCRESEPTITNCIITGNFNNSGDGAGIHCESASPEITDCLIENNETDVSGGGIACHYSHTPVIRGNIIRNNTATWGDGAGIYANYSTVLIEDNLVTGNPGAGIWCHGSDSVIIGNTITHNTGGGVAIWFGDAVLADNEISGNSGGRGTGIHGYDASLEISDCRILDNVCDQPWSFGAGISTEDCDSVIDNCLIAGNSFLDQNGAGGGLFLYNESAHITNTTISGNSAGVGGALGDQAFIVTFTNCILWGNSPAEIYTVTGYPEPDLSYCNVEGGWPGEGNLDTDPLFTGGPAGTYYLGQQGSGQPDDSPCLDSGSDVAAAICYQVLGTTLCMDQFTTRTDQVPDMDQVDMGFHYPIDLEPGEVYLVTGSGPGQGNQPLVRLFPPREAAVHEVEFNAYGSPHYGVNVACGDMDGDGLAEILTGAGPGEMYGPHVRGFRIDGTPLPGLSFMAYGTFRYGVNVISADLDGDGVDEIVTGAGPGAVFGPHVRGFSYDGGEVAPLSGVSFFAYGTLKWGVNVAGGDIDGDGRDEILTGAGPGAVFGPHVRGWDLEDLAVSSMADVSWFAYGSAHYGVQVACGDIDGDGIDEIVTAPGPALALASHIRGWEYDGAEISELPGCGFLAWSPTLPRFGARVAADCDLNGDGHSELVVGAGPDPSVGSPVKVFSYDGSSVSYQFSLQAFPPGATHGVNVAAGRFGLNLESD